MKFISLFLFTLLWCVSLTALSQVAQPAEMLTESEAEIALPNRVQANFNARYPEYRDDVEWTETEEGFQATFMKDKREVVSEFDPEGQWRGSRTELLKEDWPANARSYIQDNYGEDYTYEGGYHYQEPEGSRYVLDFRDQGQSYRLKFNGEGNFIEETTPTELD